MQQTKFGKGAATFKLMDTHGRDGNLREVMRVGLDTVINENADDDADDDENALETRDFYDVWMMQGSLCT